MVPSARFCPSPSSRCTVAHATFASRKRRGMSAPRQSIAQSVGRPPPSCRRPCCGACAVVESDQGNPHAATARAHCGLSKRKAYRRRGRISRARKRGELRILQTSQLRLRSVPRQPERLGSGRREMLSRPRQHTRQFGWPRHRHPPQRRGASRSAGRRPERQAHLVPPLLWPRKCVGSGHPGVRARRHSVHRGSMPADVL